MTFAMLLGMCSVRPQAMLTAESLRLSFHLLLTKSSQVSIWTTLPLSILFASWQRRPGSMLSLGSRNAEDL